MSAQVAQLLGAGADPRTARDALLLSARGVQKHNVSGLIQEGTGRASARGFGVTAADPDVPPAFVSVVTGLLRDGDLVRLVAVATVLGVTPDRH